MRRVGKFIGCYLIAVSLRLHKPMTTCRDTVADWSYFAVSRLLFQSSHDLHQLKKALLLLRASITLHRHYRSM